MTSRPARSAVPWPFLMAGTLTLCFSASAAGLPPDAGELMRSIEPRLSPVPAAGAGNVISEDAGQREPADSVKTVIRGFRLRGVSLLPQSRLMEVLSPFIGRSMGLAGLRAAAEKIMQAYRTENYVVFAFLPPQKITDGIVEINVVEGRLSAIEIEAPGVPLRFDREIARRHIEEQLPVGAPIDIGRLERALLLLNDLPGVSASAALDAGGETGDTRIVVRLADEPPIGPVHGSISVSNSGARSTGEYLTDGLVHIDNPTRRGDQAAVRAIAGEGLAYLRGDYRLPVGYDGWTLGAHAAHFRYRLIGDWAASQTRGRANEWVMSAAYPIVRSRTGNLHLVTSFADRRYLSTARGQDIGDKHVQVINAGLNGGRHDGLLGGGYTGYGIALSGGRLGIADAVSAKADADGPRTTGNFSKVLLTAIRRQQLTDALSMDMNLAAQRAGKNLDSSEKLYLGGAGGVRAYPSSEGGGDTGWMLSLDVRYRPAQAWALSVFADTGLLRQYQTEWTGQNGPNHVRLSGAGIGLDWEQDSWTANMTVAWRIGDNPLRDVASNADSDGTRRIPRLWIRLGKSF